MSHIREQRAVKFARTTFCEARALFAESSPGIQASFLDERRTVALRIDRSGQPSNRSRTDNGLFA